MSSRIFPLSFGDLQLQNNIIYAPLAGCTDYPFRQMVMGPGRPGLLFCEMVKMDALVRNDRGTFGLLDYSADMHPIGAQVCGCNATYAAQSAKILERMGFDVIDLNCGCPVDKVIKGGAGSALLKNPEKIEEILVSMVAAVRIPVTVKIRVGWDDDLIVGPEIVRIAERAGASAITVHGRTRKQAYRGRANRQWIKACVEAANQIRVIGNGDIFDADSALSMIEETGCDGVLVARGMLGQPWLSADIAQLDQGKIAKLKSIEQLKATLLLHMDRLEDYYPERKVVIDMRRIGCWYFHRSAKTRKFRNLISGASSSRQIRSLIENYSFAQEEQ